MSEEKLIQKIEIVIKTALNPGIVRGRKQAIIDTRDIRKAAVSVYEYITTLDASISLNQ